MAGSVFLKPMALRFSWKHWSLKKSMTNPKLQTQRSHSHSAEVDTMSSRNRRCTILSRCHLAFNSNVTCWISTTKWCILDHQKPIAIPFWRHITWVVENLSTRSIHLFWSIKSCASTQSDCLGSPKRFRGLKAPLHTWRRDNICLRSVV